MLIESVSFALLGPKGFIRSGGWGEIFQRNRKITSRPPVTGLKRPVHRRFSYGRSWFNTS